MAMLFDGYNSGGYAWSCRWSPCCSPSSPAARARPPPRHPCRWGPVPCQPPNHRPRRRRHPWVVTGASAAMTTSPRSWVRPGSSPGPTACLEPISSSPDDHRVVRWWIRRHVGLCRWVWHLLARLLLLGGGLTLLDPLGHVLLRGCHRPLGTATVTTLAQSGITLPADLEGANTWQQYVKPGRSRAMDTAACSTGHDLQLRLAGSGGRDGPLWDLRGNSRRHRNSGHPRRARILVPCQIQPGLPRTSDAIKQEQTSCSGADYSIELVSFDSP